MENRQEYQTFISLKKHNMGKFKGGSTIGDPNSILGRRRAKKRAELEREELRKTDATIPVQIEPAKETEDTIKPDTPTGAGITTTPTSTTTVLTPTQRTQQLAEEFGAGSEAVRLAGLDTPTAQFEEMIKEQDRQKKVGEELTAFERKKQEAQLQEFKKQSERAISGVQTQLAQGPEGVTTTTAPLLSEQFKQTQNKRVQLQIEQAQVANLRVQELERQAERERALGRAEAASSIIAQADAERERAALLQQQAQQAAQESQDRAFNLIGALTETGALAGMTEEERAELQPLLTALPEGVANALIRTGITSSAQAGEAAKQESQQALLKNFTALAKEGIALPMSTMQQFAEQSGLPLETFMSFNDRAQQIFADKSLSQQEQLFEIGLLESELDRKSRGVLTKETKNIDAWLKMKSSGALDALPDDLQNSIRKQLGITSSNDPEEISKQLDNQVKALKLQFDSETNPLKKQKLGLEIEKGKLAIKEQKLALKEAGFGQYGDVTDTGSYAEGKSPRLTAGGAAQGVGSAANKLEYNPSKFLTNIDFGDGSRGTVVNIGGQEMKIVQAFGGTASGEPGKHGAIDFSTKNRHDEEGKGGTIPAFTNGEIVKKGVSPSSYGGYAWIRDDKGQIWQYGHLNVDEVNALEVGQTVSEGENFIHAEHRREKWGVGSNEHLDFRMVGEQEAQAGQPEQFAEEIMKPFSTSKLSDFTKAQQEKILPFLNKKKEEALGKGDMIGVMTASAGGGNPTDTFRNKMSKGATTINQVSNLFNFMELGLKGEEVKDVKGELIDLNPLAAWFRNKNPWDTDAQTINAALQGTVPNLARGIFGEVGVLTDRDIELYKKTLPNLSQTKDVQKSVAALTMRTIRNSVENEIKINAGTGNDMSGLVTFYQELNDKVNQMEEELGIVDPERKSSTGGTDADFINEGISFLNSPEQTQITPDVESDIDSIYGF
jgi:hypothetical protein